MQHLNRERTINPIRHPAIRYATIVIRYKIYYSNQENLVSATTTHVAQDMVENGANYDLCEFLRKQLKENLKEIKKKKYVFKYSTLVMCLVFYFLKEVVAIGKVNWITGNYVAQ